MIVFAVTMDYAIEQVRFGSPEMYEARNINFSEIEAQGWIEANRPIREASSVPNPKENGHD